MENSGKFESGDTELQWYIALNNKAVGPLSETEIYQRLKTQEITWAHFVWRKGQSDWKRLCDIQPFQSLVPKQPAKSLQKPVSSAGATSQKKIDSKTNEKKSATSARSNASSKELPQKRMWFLYYNDAQYGPFFSEELHRFLQTGRIHSRVHAWKNGMKGWERIARIPEFQDSIDSNFEPKKEAPRAGSAAEKRSGPRKPLVAKILMSDEQSVIVGVCRDISIGGLQVLTDSVPGKVGSRLKMNISPPQEEDGTVPDPFLAEGVIVRILEDGRGFSFRFQRLSDGAREAIESYTQSSD